jgi:peptidyl-dipeptidase Dcp
MSRRFALPWPLPWPLSRFSRLWQLPEPPRSAGGRRPPGGRNPDQNPFFTPSTLPYGMPPFDLIRDEHYLPAFEKGMAEQLEEIEASPNNPERRRFENTIVAMERSGRLLDRVSRCSST